MQTPATQPGQAAEAALHSETRSPCWKMIYLARRNPVTHLDAALENAPADPEAVADLDPGPDVAGQAPGGGFMAHDRAG